MLLADDTEPAVIRAAISEETVAASWTPTTSPWSSLSAPPLRCRHSWRYLELIDADPQACPTRSRDFGRYRQFSEIPNLRATSRTVRPECTRTSARRRNSDG